MEKNCIDKKVIQMLRAGITSFEGVEKITVEKKEIIEVKNWVKNGTGSIVIVAPYGYGKTHINHFMEKTALDTGHIVSYLQFDSQTPMHLPGPIFYQLFQNFLYVKNGKKYNIHNIIQEYVEKINLEGKFHRGGSLFFDNSYLNNIHRIVTNLQKNKNSVNDPRYFRIWRYIFEGGPVPQWNMEWMPPNNYSTTANIYFNIFCRIILASKELGHKGVVLLFDELEKQDYLQRTEWKIKSNLFMKALFLVSKNEEILRSEEAKPGYDQEMRKEVTRGIKSTLLYYGSKKHIKYIPETNHSELGIKCAFSIVEGEGVTFYELAKEHKFPIITLKNLTDNEQEKLIKKIITVYKDSLKDEQNIENKCYEEFVLNFSLIENEFVKKILEIVRKDIKKDESTRRLVRLTVAGLDLFKKFGKKINIDELLRLDE